MPCSFMFPVRMLSSSSFAKVNKNMAQELRFPASPNDVQFYAAFVSLGMSGMFIAGSL